MPAMAGGIVAGHWNRHAALVTAAFGDGRSHTVGAGRSPQPLSGSDPSAMCKIHSHGDRTHRVCDKAHRLCDWTRQLCDRGLPRLGGRRRSVWAISGSWDDEHAGCAECPPRCHGLGSSSTRWLPRIVPGWIVASVGSRCVQISGRCHSHDLTRWRWDETPRRAARNRRAECVPGTHGGDDGGRSRGLDDAWSSRLQWHGNRWHECPWRTWRDVAWWRRTPGPAR